MIKVIISIVYQGDRSEKVKMVGFRPTELFKMTRINKMWHEDLLFIKREATLIGSSVCKPMGVCSPLWISTEQHLNRDKIESNLGVPGIQGLREIALI